MLALGTGVILTEQISMDIAYHYFDLGRVETSQGNMYMDTRPAGIAVNGIESHRRTHMAWRWDCVTNFHPSLFLKM